MRDVQLQVDSRRCPGCRHTVSSTDAGSSREVLRQAISGHGQETPVLGIALHGLRKEGDRCVTRVEHKVG